MQTPFIGTILMFGGNYAPQGWMFCNGSTLPISQYDALFSLIGTTYGGDGSSTFQLPDLRGRMPVHQGQAPGLSPYQIGQMSGTETVTLLAPQVPVHSHLVVGSSGTATSANPANNFLATQSQLLEYNPGTSANSVMKATAVSVSPVQATAPHENMMPTLVMNYIIAYDGIYPTQN